MIYKDFKGEKLSALGFGAMRLPVVEGNNAVIDEAATAEMIAYAMDKGVNYFDTAWGYHDGNSETVMGKLLQKYPRDSYYIATKFPGYDVRNMSKVKEIFPRQLEKTGMDHFDFYLLHNVCEKNIDQYLNEENGILPYLLEQKALGRFKYFGFSAHGTREVMERFLDMYGPYMEFCQLQLNWLDWEFQDVKGKVELLNRWNIPVWVMEPVRGGKLVQLPEDEEVALKALRPNETVPGMAFRFIQTLPEVKVTLSGMSNIQQLRDNIRTYETDEPFTPEEMESVLALARKKVSKIALPCTECRYCTTHCPQQLDIPRLIALYNEYTVTGGGFLAPMVVGTLPEEKKPSACIGCRSCEAVCPQNIAIADALADFAEKLS